MRLTTSVRTAAAGVWLCNVLVALRVCSKLRREWVVAKVAACTVAGVVAVVVAGKDLGRHQVGGGAHLLQRDQVAVAGLQPFGEAAAGGGANPVDIDGRDPHQLFRPRASTGQLPPSLRT